MIKRNGYAKINLYLSVTGKADNGYHTVETVYQAISLSDTVYLEPTGSGPLRLFCSDSSLQNESNLAFRAMRGFLSAVGAPQKGFSLKLEKRIPVSSGLAGGSTDAAATLLLLNSFFGSPLPKESLLRLAAALGADVPFCVLANAGEPSQVGTHLGEILQPAPSLPPCTVLVIPTGEKISTAEAYLASDRFPPDSEGGYREVLRALEQNDLSGVFQASYNRFERVSLPQCPVAERLFSVLASSGADCVRMSGSGPSLLAFFAGESGEKRARDVIRRIGKHGETAFLCSPIQNIKGDRD